LISVCQKGTRSGWFRTAVQYCESAMAVRVAGGPGTQLKDQIVNSSIACKPCTDQVPPVDQAEVLCRRARWPQGQGHVLFNIGVVDP
jgi:hypothetical protein